jgi:hypothetical protein
LAAAPWLLTPAVGIAGAVLALNLLAHGRHRADAAPTTTV